MYLYIISAHSNCFSESITNRAGYFSPAYYTVTRQEQNRYRLFVLMHSWRVWRCANLLRPHVATWAPTHGTWTIDHSRQQRAPKHDYEKI